MEHITGQELDIWQKAKYMLRLSARATFIPTPKNYARLADEVQGSKRMAWLWYFISVLVSQIAYYIYAFFAYYVFVIDNPMDLFSTAELGYSDKHIMQGVLLFAIICGGPLIALVRTAVFAVRIWLQNWLAKMMKGEGEYDSLAILNAGFTGPLLILKRFCFLIPVYGSYFTWIHYLTPLLEFVLSVYQYILTVFALRTVKKISWAKAVLIVLLELTATLFIYAIVLAPVFILAAYVMASDF